jgi:hypothetical protein
MSRALPPPSSYHNPPPSTCSGAWLKPTSGSHDLGGPKSSLSFPLDMLGGLAKANLKVARPKGTSLNEYEASCCHE